MLQVGIVIAIAFVLQGTFSCVQMKYFSNEFVKLRRKGRVACGRKSGGFHAGAIVMFQIDDDGIIQEARKMEGTTVLARVKPLPGFEGRNIRDLTEADGPRNHRNLCKAIADASLTYQKYTAGEVIPEPPSPFQKVGYALGSIGRRKRTTL